MNHHSKASDGGAGWRLQRKVAAKVFTNVNFRVFVEQVFARHAEEILVTAQVEGNQGSFCCDMQEISAKYTLRSIFNVAFGISLSKVAVADEFACHMDFINKHCAQRLFVKQYYKILRWFMPSEQELRWRTREVRSVADAVLLQRLGESQEEINARSDLLSLFIRKARETVACSLLGAKTLRSVILTFVFAGRDTTAECLTYSFYAIARHPRVQERIVEELESLRLKTGSNPTPFTFDAVKSMRYLEAVVYEVIRLYPALPYNVKNAVEDDYLPDGTFVPAGVDVVYSPWYMGRNGALWGDDPLEFRPERWLEMTKRPSAYEFPAFQAGPRICLGMNMAVLEAKLFLATTLHRFHVAIAPGEKIERNYVLKSGLFMENGLPLQLTSRLQCASSA
ncbi:hypothetical protein DVH05_014579 [Phytophthora capsici]|nr:hypothetical protein DVH05_014579 [Phytophthora capsici]